MKRPYLFVNIKSRSMLPKLDPLQLDALATRIGLTLAQLERLQEVAYGVYQEIGHDLAELGEMTRYVVVETVLDAGRVRERLGRNAEDQALIPAYDRLSDYPLDHVYEAFAAGFPYPRYE